MMNRMNPMRRYTRFPVSWPVVYGNDQFLAEGTVLDVTSRGWRVAGSMPVVAGMQVTLRASAPEKPELIHVQRATVLWVKDHEFALEAHEMSLSDQAWVNEFLQLKLGLTWIAQPEKHAFSRETGGEVSDGKTDRAPQPSAQCVEEILQQLHSLHSPLEDMPPEARQHEDEEIREDETDIACDRIPEEIVHQAFRLLRGMIAMKTFRKRTGRNTISNN